MKIGEKIGAKQDRGNKGSRAVYLDQLARSFFSF